MALWRRTDDNRIFDPLSFDPFPDFPFPSFSNLWDLGSSRRNIIPQDVANVANTQVDWKETADAHVIKADLPGLRKEEVKVEVEENRVLKISGERKREETEKNERWHRVERAYGGFVRRFRLPQNAKVEEVKASMENGVLTVHIPKTPQPQPEVKSIDISG